MRAAERIAVLRIMRDAELAMAERASVANGDGLYWEDIQDDCRRRASLLDHLIKEAGGET